MTEPQISFYSVPAYKRMRRSNTGILGAALPDCVTPAPAYADNTIRRTNSSMPVRILRRLTNKPEESFDPHTIPLLSRREQRKAEKREQRKLEELQAYQRKQFHDQISWQLEVNQITREVQASQPQTRRTVKEKVKDTLRRTTRTSKKPKTQPTGQNPTSSTAQHPPHIDDFNNKSELTTWFQKPSDVEALPPPATTIDETYPAELPAADVQSPYLIVDAGPANKHFDGILDIDSLPPPIRSPSPCLSAVPRRGITVSETPATPSSRQMQCDYCHSAIKLTGFHYVCNLCNDGDCLYCANCTARGNTCRHDLVERTRNIRRHPTNPQIGERRSIERDFPDVSVKSVELSAKGTTISAEAGPSTQPTPSASQIESQSPVSPTASEDILRDFEARRRDQEVAFREKEVILREREAMLREREAWTASRERDAALVQQLHAAAMLQQRAEVGAQFLSTSPISRQSSHYDRSSRTSYVSRPDTHHTPSSSRSIRRQPSSASPTAGNKLHPIQREKQPNIELVSSAAVIEASIAGFETADGGIRTHANSNKRKSAAPENKASHATESSKKGQPSKVRRALSRRSSDELEDDEDGSDASSPKRQKQEASISGERMLFACPYYKHDPDRYSPGNTTEVHYRKCASGLFRDISRVKQHLKRTHHRPDFYCRRCFAVLETNDKLQKHASSRQGCDVQQCPWPEKLEETQQSKIHVKRPGKDPRELWFEIFSIIFPGATLPDSPYIDQAQTKDALPETLEHFIQLFNQKLDLASQSRPWLASSHARDFLNAQMTLTMHEMRSDRSVASSIGVPSVLISPVSPSASYTHKGRQSSQSSRASSGVPGHVAPSSLSADGIHEALRPALKVTTYGMYPGSAAVSVSPSDSARSQHNRSFPKVPRHVREDPGYGDQAGESWVSGDDVPLMGDNTMPLCEPSSATSTRSTKSVSFAPPPQTWTPFTDPHPEAPNLLDFTTVDWSAQNFATGANDMQAVQHLSYNQQQKQPQRSRADSAYGTLSSAQASRTSLALFQTTPQLQQTQSYDSFLDHDQHEQLTCVDPQMLFMSAPHSAPMTPGLSADVQAYFNRDVSGNGNGHIDF